MEVIIDNRETKLKEYFSSQINNIEWQNKCGNIEGLTIIFDNLDIGDVIIKYNDEVKYIFERKTIRDLSDSIKDNRYHEQKQRMKYSITSDIKICYIFEYFKGYDGLVKDLQINNLRGDIILSAILNTTVRDNFGIFLTNDTNETIFVLEELILRMFKSQDKYFNKVEKIDNSCLLKKRKKDNINRDNILVLYLSQIPGVSSSIGERLSSEFITMNGLITFLNKFEIIEEKISYLENIEVELKNNKKRKIGKKTATRIIELLF